MLFSADEFFTMIETSLETVANARRSLAAPLVAFSIGRTAACVHWQAVTAAITAGVGSKLSATDLINLLAAVEHAAVSHEHEIHQY